MRKIKMLQKAVDDLSIDLQRTNQRVDGLATSVEALETRVKVLEILKEMQEKRIEELENAQEAEPETASMGRRLQDGIDSIMGYQWPPAKGDNE